LSAATSSDPDKDDVLQFQWNVANGANGDIESQAGEQATFTFTEPGTYEVTLTVTDPENLQDSETLTFSIGNAPPVMRFVKPVDGGFFDWGAEVDYEIVVEDAEEGSSKDSPEFMKLRLLLNHFVAATTPGTTEAAYLSGAGKYSAGLSLIQQSDCLNCHAIDRRIIGPSFKEIAQRYASADDQNTAIQTSAERIIKGSSKVWGEVPMLPHVQFSQDQAETIVRWIFSLSDDTGSHSVQQEFAGKNKIDRPDWMKQVMGGAAVWQASYTDLGAEGATPLTAKAEVLLRSSLVEAEHFTRKEGTQVLSSKSASSGQFIGSVSNGQSLVFERVNLKQIHTIEARIASPETGGSIELRKNDAKGALIARLKFTATGGWEQWQTVNTQTITDPGGLHDLCVVFVNPKEGQPFMNLDWLRFRSR
jgi:cytochrome c